MEKQPLRETGGRVMRTAQANHHTANDEIYIAADKGWIGRDEGDGGDLETGQRDIFRERKI